MLPDRLNVEHTDAADKLRISKRRAVQERVAELQEQGLDCDPIKVLMELAIGKAQGPDGIYRPIIAQYDERGHPIMLDSLVRVKAASELMQYMYPKLKSVEVTGREGQAITFAVVAEEAVGEELRQLADQPMNLLPQPEEEPPLIVANERADDETIRRRVRRLTSPEVPPATGKRPSEMEF